MSFAAFANALPVSLSLVGRTALITGSSSGIGRQTALALARSGAKILCTDLQPDPIDAITQTNSGSKHIPTHKLITSLGGKAEFQQLNVTSHTEFKAAIDRVVQYGNGRLDIVVNNAGITSFSGGIEHESLDIFDRMMNINVKGSFIGTKLAVEQMLKQEPVALPGDMEEDLDSMTLTGSGSDAVPLRPSFADEVGPADPTFGRQETDKGGRGSRGTIVQIASIHGLIGGPSEPAYCASKGAVINLTRQVACDYAPYRINVNAICPGYLDTAMTSSILPHISAQRPTYWPHRGAGRDVAKSVMYFVRDAPWSTGTILTLDGGTTAR